MEIIFKSENREFRAEVESVDEIFEAVRDGMVAMSYHENTADELKKELEELQNTK